MIILPKRHMFTSMYNQTADKKSQHSVFLNYTCICTQLNTNEYVITIQKRIDTYNQEYSRDYNEYHIEFFNLYTEIYHEYDEERLSNLFNSIIKKHIIDHFQDTFVNIEQYVNEVGIELIPQVYEMVVRGTDVVPRLENSRALRVELAYSKSKKEVSVLYDKYGSYDCSGLFYVDADKIHTIPIRLNDIYKKHILDSLKQHIEIYPDAEQSIMKNDILIFPDNFVDFIAD